MQTIGFVQINGETIKVLIRVHSYYVSLKLRSSGTMGNHMVEEEQFLSDRPDLVKQLMDGQVIHL